MKKQVQLFLVLCLGVLLFGSPILGNDLNPEESDEVVKQEEKTQDEKNKETTPSQTEVNDNSVEAPALAVIEEENIIESKSQNIEVASNAGISIDEWMPDKNLQQLVAEAINKPVEQISQEDMLSLTRISLDSASAPVNSMKGLEYALNLDTISVSDKSGVIDFSPIEGLSKLRFVSFTTPSLTDANFPNLPKSVQYLYLVGSSITSDSLYKVSEIDSLIYLQLMNIKGITSLEPLVGSKSLERINMQFTYVHDFTPITKIPTMKNLYAYGQTLGDDSSRSTVYKDVLDYNEETETLTIPVTAFPNRLTHFNGYQPQFTSSTSENNMVMKLNGVQVSGDRITSTTDQLIVSGISIKDYEDLTEIYFTARLNNAYGSYETPVGYEQYYVSGGIYTNNLDLIDKENEVKVEYVDDTGVKIADDKSIIGVVGTNYDASTEEYVISIPGYTLDSSKLPTNAKGKITEEQTIVTYTYNKDVVETSNVVVNYIDENGNKISEPKVVNGIVGESYDVSTPEYQIDIPGFTLDSKQLPTNSKGNFTSEDINVTYVYIKDKIAVGTVLVEYIDENNNVIAPTKIINGTVGTTFDASVSEYLLEISGYKLNTDRLPENAKGTFTLGVQRVQYVYTKQKEETSNVLVKYVDENNTEIAPSKNVIGTIGDTYDVSTDEYKIEVDGYFLDSSKLPINSKGIISSETIVVTYVYKQDKVESSSVLVRFVDDKNNEIAPSKLIKGIVGSSYDVSTLEYKLNISGYRLNLEKLPTNAKGKLKSGLTTVTYVYSKDIEANSRIIIKYVDQDNNEIYDAKILSNKVGEIYDVSSSQYLVDIDGYTLDESKLPRNAKGYYQEEDTIVVYSYNKNKENPEKDKETKKDKSSPSTGVRANTSLTYLLIASTMMLGICITAYYKRKKSLNK